MTTGALEIAMTEETIIQFKTEIEESYQQFAYSDFLFQEKVVEQFLSTSRKYFELDDES